MTSQVESPAQVSKLELIAPISGEIYPLDQVPDPVFAQKMVGEGFAIEPTENTLYAPCDGVISHIHKSQHAIRVTSPSGVEVLMHVGLDTVKLRGEGFSVNVKEGEQVSVKQPLMTFDADTVSLKAKSLMTEIIIMNSERVAEFNWQTGKVRGGVDLSLSLSLNAGSTATQQQSDLPWQLSAPLTLKNPQGIHARPAAALSNLAKTFDAELQIRLDDRECDARSVIGLMSLNSSFADQVVVAARGTQAEQAMQALCQLIESGLGEEVDDAPVIAKAVEVPEETPLALAETAADCDLKGIAASSGVAIGPLHVWQEQKFNFAEQAESSSSEVARLQQAIEQLQTKLSEQISQVAKQEAEIFKAHLEILSDPALVEGTNSIILQGKTAEFAWTSTIESQIQVLESLNNPLLAQRAADLKDIQQRVMVILQHADEQHAIPAGVILVVEDLTPSMLSEISQSQVAGIISKLGGATSHAAILARAAGIPYIAGVNLALSQYPAASQCVLFGHDGRILLDPPAAELTAIQQQQQLEKQQKADALAKKDQAAITLDNIQLEVVGNIANKADAIQCVEMGGEGVGLLRSEFLFQGRIDAPTEEEQFAAYCAIQKALQGRPLIVRTLDVGGDKPLSYMPLPEEENPFLGERGIRVSFSRPSFFRTQIRAILRANALHQPGSTELGEVRIMFPMVSVLEEVRVAKEVVVEEANALGVPFCSIGIMVEIPTTAAMAEQFAKEVDFFSVGSNDLTQYAMAIDRGHPKLAGMADGLNPGILQLIKMTVEGAHAHGKWVGVCGGLASEPEAVPLLIGLGVDELSVSVPQIPEVKEQIRHLQITECKQLAQQALACGTADEVRQLVKQVASEQQPVTESVE